MELRVLSYFVAVAEAGSVSGAAQSLHITQPTLSRQIRQLEHEIGADLFTRVDGRLSLNAAGREFLPFARDLTIRAQSAREAGSSLAAGRLTRISIAAPTTTLIDIVAPFLATFSPEDPAPSVAEIDVAEDLGRLLVSVDLAIVSHAPPANVAAEPTAVLPVWAYVPVDHPWASGTSVELADIVAQPLVVTTPDHKARRILDSAVELAGLSPVETIETSSGQIAQALAAAGRGVAVVSDDARFDLVPIPIETTSGPLSLGIYAAWRPDHHASQAIRRMAYRLRLFCEERYGPTLPRWRDVSDRS